MSATVPKKAMLFAAGLGTRLRPLTLARPKPLIEVAGKPLIHYAIEALRDGGVEEIMINTHYLAEQIPQALGDGSQWGMRFHYSHEPVLLGTGGGLLKVRDFFADAPRFWVVNSDTLLSVSFKEVWEHHERSQAVATLVVHMQTPPVFGGVWMHRATETIAAFFSPPPDADLGNIVMEQTVREVDFCGVSLLSPAIFPYLAAAQTRTPAPCLVRNGFAPMLEEGAGLHAYPYNGYFNDVGTLERLMAATEYWQRPSVKK